VKLLLDGCVCGGARVILKAAGHDVIWAGEWAEDPGGLLEAGAIVTVEPGRIRIRPPAGA
jgi:hypothetical protein